MAVESICLYFVPNPSFTTLSSFSALTLLVGSFDRNTRSRYDLYQMCLVGR